MKRRDPRDVAKRALEIPYALRRVRALHDYVGKPNRKVREYVARLYLRGDGIEIGALHSALALPAHATARYVDRASTEELREQYPELDSSQITSPDIVDDAESLATLPDASQDFVVANHFLEHCQDPLGALMNMIRVTRPGGVVFLAIPDKRFTFDSEREVTTLEHLRRDHEEGPEQSRRLHFEDWARHVEGRPDKPAEEVATELMQRDYSIHYHVWTELEMLELLVTLRRDYDVPFDVELFLANDIECVAVLRKRADRGQVSG